MRAHLELSENPGAGARARVLLAALAMAVVVILAGCASPPPALPKSVLAKGEAGLSEKHPRLSEAQRQNCKGCHREVPDPIQKP